MSPHLDDAVFSAGARLVSHVRAGDDVTVLTCLTGNVERPEGFALACQLDKGLPPTADYMALRRAEDRAACSVIGATAIHWDFLEAPHRGYADAASLFAAARPDDGLTGALADAFVDHFEHARYDRIYGPWGVGDHVDHVAVRSALEAAVDDIVWWEDFPYAMREPASPDAIVRRAAEPVSLERKIEAALCYVTQIPFQFGSPKQARAALSQWRAEGFSR